MIEQVTKSYYIVTNGPVTWEIDFVVLDHWSDTQATAATIHDLRGLVGCLYRAVTKRKDYLNIVKYLQELEVLKAPIVRREVEE